MKKYLLVSFSVLLFLPNLFHKDINPILPYNHIEQFNPKLSYLNTINKLETYIDSIATSRRVPIGDNLEYMEIVANVIRSRFYHGFSHFDLSEDWIAAFAGRFIWYDLSCKVKPEEIMKYSYAACSQQELVLMSVLRDKHISYRSVLFPHHYALEVIINNKWYYFDTNMEPKIHGEERWSANWYNSADSLKRYYDTIEFKDLDFKFGKNHPLMYGTINEIPAAHARFFDSVTGIISKIAWIFPLLLFFIPGKKSVKPTEISENNLQ